jgi:hypothetical protein
MSSTKKKRSKKRGRRYGKAASRKVGKALRERKRGTLRSGRSKKKVKSRQQAIAIGLSEARRQGAKVPPRGKKKSGKKRAGTKKRGTKKRGTKKR